VYQIFGDRYGDLGLSWGFGGISRVKLNSMPDINDTINPALLRNMTPREINALLNTRTSPQRRMIRAMLSPKQRVHLKQWQREHPVASSSDHSATGMMLLGVVVLVVFAFGALFLFSVSHVKLFK
jgi:hypothetical protein